MSYRFYLVTYAITAPGETEPYQRNTVTVGALDEATAQADAIEWCYSNDPYIHTCTDPIVTLQHVEEA